jgi:transposase-like protein
MRNADEELADVPQRLEISEATCFRWRNGYRREYRLGGMKSEEAKRLKQLEIENARLKKLLAEAELDKAMLKDIAQGNF